MIQITKIFRFEMAHAIAGYDGKCKNIHGHSYVLYVTVSSAEEQAAYIPSTGFVFDFKDLKKIVNETVIGKLDHQLVLSRQYLNLHPGFQSAENLLEWEMEPSAENIVFYVAQILQKAFPAHIGLVKLQLYETADSYAEWIATGMNR